METLEYIRDKIYRRLSETFPNYKFAVYIKGDIREIIVNIDTDMVKGLLDEDLFYLSKLYSGRILDLEELKKATIALNKKIDIIERTRVIEDSLKDIVQAFSILYNGIIKIEVYPPQEEQ